MKTKFLRRFILYLLRWQLSTPILWLVVRNLGAGLSATVIANLIGASIFFWVDRFIFTSRAIELWHYKDNDYCENCQSKTALWRLVKTSDYDRSQAEPVFLCLSCCKEKLKELNARGVETVFCPHR